MQATEEVVELTSGLEDTSVTVAVARGESLHHTVNLLGLAGQPEAPQELSVTQNTPMT